MKKKYADGGMFREGMDVPQDIDGASAGLGKKRPKPGMVKPPMKRPTPKPGMAKPPMKRPTPKGSVFREGMDVPQDIDGGSVGLKKGGSVSKRADGIAKKGKTKGKFV